MVIVRFNNGKEIQANTTLERAMNYFKGQGRDIIKDPRGGDNATVWTAGGILGNRAIATLHFVPCPAVKNISKSIK